MIVKNHSDGAVFESMKGSWREADVWYYMAGLYDLKKVQKKLLVKAQSSFNRRHQHREDVKCHG